MRRQLGVILTFDIRAAAYTSTDTDPNALIALDRDFQTNVLFLAVEVDMQLRSLIPPLL